MKLYLIVMDTWFGGCGSYNYIFGITTSRDKAEEIVDYIKTNAVDIADKYVSGLFNDPAAFIEWIRDEDPTYDVFIIEVGPENINTFIKDPIPVGGYIE